MGESNLNSDELDRLNKKVDKLEYTEIANLKDKITGIELELNKNSILTESNTKAMEKMSNTMEKVGETMVLLTSGIEQSNKSTQELSKKVTNLEGKIDNIEDKTKFDIMLFIKENWIGIVIGVGVLSYLFLQ